MLQGVRAGLTKAEELPVGVTGIDLAAYMRHAAGISHAGLSAEASRRFTNSLTGYASVSGGVMRMDGVTSLEATGMLGMRGTF